jgi:hypothetical protein
MKKIFAIAGLVLSVGFAQAQPPNVPATPGSNFGAKVNPKGATDIKELPATLDGKEEATVKVKATVLDVCPKKGCWLKLAINDSTTAFVKMQDYAFFLPTAIKGKTIVVDGEAVKKTTSVAELKHYAMDAKKSDAEIAAITQPEEEIRLTAKGIVVVQ